MATTDSILVYRGEQATLNFTMSPVENITSWAIVFTLSRKVNTATKVLTQAATILNGAAGTFRVTLTEEQLDLTPGTYQYDVWRNDEGQEQVLAIGTFTVAPAVRTPV